MAITAIIAAAAFQQSGDNEGRAHGQNCVDRGYQLAENIASRKEKIA